MRAQNFSYLGKTFGRTGLSTIKDGNLGLTVIDLRLRLHLRGHNLRSLDDFLGSLRIRPPPNQHHKTPNQNCHRRRQYHENLPIVRHHHGDRVRGGVSRHVGGVYVSALQNCRHQIERRHFDGSGLHLERKLEGRRKRKLKDFRKREKTISVCFLSLSLSFPLSVSLGVGVKIMLRGEKRGEGGFYGERERESKLTKPD